LEGIWAYLALLFLRESKSLNARHDLGETFHMNPPCNLQEADGHPNT
jgi:hypothetical protein